MKKRITLVACFDSKSIDVINNSLQHINKTQLCKVPYHIENRIYNDTLPFHITLSAWDIDKKDIILEKLPSICFNKIKLEVVFDIIENSDKSLLLYLKPVNQLQLRHLQRLAYDILPTNRYNPEKYLLHSTINISDNINQIREQLSSLSNIKLELVIDKICLFEIYPAKLITTQSFKK